VGTAWSERMQKNMRKVEFPLGLRGSAGQSPERGGAGVWSNPKGKACTNAGKNCCQTREIMRRSPVFWSSSFAPDGNQMANEGGGFDGPTPDARERV